MSKSALVAGGTGLVGNQLVKLLKRSNQFDSVKVIVRKGSNFSEDGVSAIEVNYDQLADYAIQLQANVVFCCLGTTIAKAKTKENFRKVDYDYPVKLAEISRQNGCMQFNLITAAGADPNSMFFYNRTKGETEKSISALQIRNLNIFRPSLLLGNRKEKRFGEMVGAVFSRMMNPLMLGNLKKYRAIESGTVAKAMVNIAQKETIGIRIFESHLIQTLGEEYLDK